MILENNDIVFYKIDKTHVFSSLRQLYSNKLSILDKFKEDYKDISIIINNKKIDNFYKFLEYINSNYSNYLEKILLICSKTLFTVIIKLIKERICNNLHILKNNNNNNINIQITLNHLIKQIYISSNFYIIHMNENSDILNKRPVIISCILDISNSENILIKVENT